MLSVLLFTITLLIATIFAYFLYQGKIVLYRKKPDGNDSLAWCCTLTPFLIFGRFAFQELVYTFSSSILEMIVVMVIGVLYSGIVIRLSSPKKEKVEI